MTIPCTFSRKNWENILNLLYRAKESKMQSVESFSGFRKIEAQKDINDIGQTGSSTRTIDSAIRNIRHKIEQIQQENKIIILLDPNMYHLIERLKRRKFRLKKAIRRSKHPINSPLPR
jgi:hypothetical protein